MAIPRTSLPNLRINSGLLKELANPSFSARAGEAIGQAMLGPQLRKEKKETEAFYQQLIKAGQEGNSATVGTLLAGQGVKLDNPQMVLQGMGMMTAAKKQEGLIAIDSFMDVYSDPTRSVEDRNFKMFLLNSGI